MHLALNRKGFSVLEMAAAVGILGFLVLTASQVMILSRRANVGGKAKIEFLNLKTQLERSFSSETACTSMLGTQTVDRSAATPVDIFESDGSGKLLDKAPPDQSVNRFGRVHINAVNFEPIEVMPSHEDGRDYLMGNIALGVEILGESTPGGSEVMGEFIPVILKVDSSDVILSCHGADPDAMKPARLPTCSPGEYMTFSSGRRWECVALP